MAEMYLTTSGSKSIAGPVSFTAVVFSKPVQDSIFRNYRRYRWSQVASTLLELDFVDETLLFPVQQINCQGVKLLLIEKIDALIARLALRGYHNITVVTTDSEIPTPKSTMLFRRERRSLSSSAANAIAHSHIRAWCQLYGERYQEYNWPQNQGRPTSDHLQTILTKGLTPYHRTVAIQVTANWLIKTAISDPLTWRKTVEEFVLKGRWEKQFQEPFITAAQLTPAQLNRFLQRLGLGPHRYIEFAPSCPLRLPVSKTSKTHIDIYLPANQPQSED